MKLNLELTVLEVLLLKKCLGDECARQLDLKRKFNKPEDDLIKQTFQDVLKKLDAIKHE